MKTYQIINKRNEFISEVTFAELQKRQSSRTFEESRVAVNNVYWGLDQECPVPGDEVDVITELTPDGSAYVRAVAAVV